MINSRHFRLLFYFTEIAQSGSIRGAASKLNLSPAVVSAALFDLEELLGTTLIRRSTRRMELTNDGLRFLEKAVAAIDAFEAAFDHENTSQTDISGSVAITLPTELATIWMPTVISAFKKAYSNIETVIHADDVKIERLNHSYDIAIRTEFSVSPALGRNGIVAYPLELVCLSELQETLSGHLERDLRKVGFICSDHQVKNNQLYCTKLGAKTPSPVSVQPGFNINNRQVALELTRRGMGAALLISESVRRDLERRTLIRVNPAYEFGFVIVRILMLDKRPSRAAKAFRDFISKQLLEESVNGPEII